jgi:hypothetical protein
MNVAYLAEGKLFLAEPGQKPRPVESHFVQEMLDRQEQQRQRHDWKEGAAWDFSPGSMMRPRSMPGTRPVVFNCVTRGPASGEMMYALQTQAVGGLFVYELKTGYERRLLHRADFSPHDLTRNPDDGSLAISLQNEDGTADIAVMNAQGKAMKAVTGGDSVDQSPAWVPGKPRSLLYQSAGVGRNAQGMVSALGPYAILRLDLDNPDDMETLRESDDLDYLSPRMAADGSLYYIRRPHEAVGKVSPWRVMRDVLLFPVGLVMAFVHFFDWFSMVFRQKPLLTANGPKREPAEARHMMLWGKLIDADKAMARARSKDDAPLVPKEWTLVRSAPDGTETDVAQNVAAFDLAPDGSVVYSTGSSIYHLPPGGTPTLVGQGRLIEQVACIA